jgi:endonuclease V-like protein UPF0215 family
MFQNVYRNIDLRLRSIGVDDGGFPSAWPPSLRSGKALLVSALLRGLWLERVRLGEITVDGFDATNVLTNLLKNLTFNIVFLSGVSFAGFNVVDAVKIHKEFKKPIIVVASEKPNNKAVKNALRKHFKDWRSRWRVIEKLGKVHHVVPIIGGPPLYFEATGIDVKSAKLMIRVLTASGRIPEPVRVARLIARGLTHSERL